MSARLFLAALFAGTLGAAGALAFRDLVLALQRLLFGLNLEVEGTRLEASEAWLLLLAPALGGLLIGALVQRLLSEWRAHGIPDVIARAEGGAPLGLRDALGTALLSIMSLGFGASVGREGPVVHLGAALAAAFHRRFALPAQSERLLLAAGASGAVAASFNAPIAALLFSTELILGRRNWRQAVHLILPAIIGLLAYRWRDGAEPLFPSPGMAAFAWQNLLFALPLGALMALVAVLLGKAVFLANRGFQALALSPALRTALAGLAVGALALISPRVLGVGYETALWASQGGGSLWFLVILAMAKFAATALSLGGGFVGGIFSPSLVLGALLGAALAAALGLPAAPLALAGMGAFAAQALGAPLSTLAMMAELAGDAAALPTSALAIAGALLVGRAFGFPSFFRAVLARR